MSPDRDDNDQKPAALDTEEQVLASLSASLQAQDVYEDQVIRDATHAAVPKLVENGVVAGFPDLKDLAAASSTQVVYQVLTQIRRAQQSNPENPILHLQEQMLLMYLHQQGTRDLPIRNNEARHEKNRQSLAATSTIPTVAASSAPPPVARRPRVPLMKRKQVQVPPEEEEKKQKKKKPVDEKAMEEHRERLRQLRKERQERRARRRLQLKQYDEETSEEEADFSKDDTVVKIEPVDQNEEETMQEDVENDQERSGTATCPLCQEVIEIQDLSQADAELTLHIQECQTRRRSRRQRGVKATNVKETTPAAGTSRKRKRTAQAILPTHTDAKDDWEEWVYMDRVDEWIEEGLGKMREMKERATDDELPGEQTLDGGLYIPAWINDRLFGYQREGLQWMWDLHQQQCGGIVGDQMGLVSIERVASCAALGCF